MLLILEPQLRRGTSVRFESQFARYQVEVYDAFRLVSVLFRLEIVQSTVLHYEKPSLYYT